MNPIRDMVFDRIAEMRRSNFLYEDGMRRALDTFQRIGRWGTCVECPYVGHVVHPENCVHTKRGDHQLEFQYILDRYNSWKRKMSL